MWETPIILVGGGKMGQAMLAGWIQSAIPASLITVIEPEEKAATSIEATYHTRALLSPASLSPLPAIIVLATKPQTMDSILPAYMPFAKAGAVFLSIAAGKTLAYFAKHLGNDTPIIRAMPNLPATIGEGVTVLCANSHITSKQRAEMTTLCEAVGTTYWIEEESLIDAVTALSGSGPAYVFYLIETLAKAGVTLGLPETLANQLAVQTVYGSAALAVKSPYPAAMLREQVTSPKGTTEAALKILMGSEGISKSFEKALLAAKKRSEELAE